MSENKQYILIPFEEGNLIFKDDGREFFNSVDCLKDNEIVDLLNEQEETIQELLKYKYLVKALEEVSGSHYIEEIISDYSDGAVSDEKEQLELGKWHSEHGLSWEDSDSE